MNSYLKPAALLTAAIFLLVGFEAKASAGLDDPAAVSRNVPAVYDPEEEPEDPHCDLARLMKLTGAGGRTHTGSREESPLSAPAKVEPPVFVKNPFLSTAP
jgi:hypothetical protein